MAKKYKKKVNDSCRFNEGVQCLEWGLCDTCGWRPGVEKERKERMVSMQHDLCQKCAEIMKEGYILKRIRGGVDNKVTCAQCGKRRYGATYELTKKETK